MVARRALTPRHRAPPPLRLLHARTAVHDFAILTYVASAAAVRALMPAALPDGRALDVDVRTLDDGRRVALVSAVVFRDVGFHFPALPWPRPSMGQTNYRAYVLVDGAPAVWFFGTSLSGPFVWWPRLAWRLPWHPARMSFDVAWQGERCTSYRHQARSSFAPLSLELAGGDAPMGRLDGFVDEEDTLVALTHPLDGFYRRRDGVLGGYSIWHPPLTLQRGRLLAGHVPLFRSLGLVDEGAAPHSVLLQRATEFIIQLPPRRL